MGQKRATDVISKLQGKREVRNIRSSWNDNIKVLVKATERKDMNLIYIVLSGDV
jgi:hypothetical protein